ncbi:unnamed protein product, partial [Nesidiocoris tenuis]
MGCPRVAFIISASRYLGKTPALSRKDTRRTNAVISGQSAKRFVKEGRSLKVWRSRGSEFENRSKTRDPLTALAEVYVYS